ncbi:hypothetical protein [Evansella halocellulosilytica]|uniref:hypothetical protein n=1 Tax=Evansella halocellulosilytica TaxID=2011013 RepID=UPI000BB7D518|nr:hypothetical protein [Evansella halocellulosilytica]
MEKVIHKWFVYGLVIGLSVAILFVNYKEVYDFELGYSTEYVPVYDYVVKVLPFGVGGGFIGAIVGLSTLLMR